MRPGEMPGSSVADAAAALNPRYLFSGRAGKGAVALQEGSPDRAPLLDHGGRR